jgi:hypothetical protein
MATRVKTHHTEIVYAAEDGESFDPGFGLSDSSPDVFSGYREENEPAFVA